MTESCRGQDTADLFGLPEAAQQQARITKKMLAERFEDRTPADARLITKAVASATLTGILRPETIQVPHYQDDERLIIDIPVIDVVLNDKITVADRMRVAGLVHRSMAKPVVLFIRTPHGTSFLSLALSHVSRTDPERSTSVIDAHLMVPAVQVKPGTLHLSRLDHTDMWALYRDLVRTAAADGQPANAALGATTAVQLRRRLIDLEAELAATAREAKQAKNQQVRIDRNTKARALRTEIDHVKATLYKC